MLTGAGVLVGLLAGASAGLGRVPRRCAAGLGPRSRGFGRPSPGSGSGGTVGGLGGGGWFRRVGKGPEGGGDARLAALLVEVASSVRAGAAPADAWSRALGTAVPDRVPSVAQLACVAGGGRGGRRTRGSPAPPLAAVVAAARVADELGAPLAAVLEQVAAALAAQAEADADVQAALAGPRSSARVLAWLPLLGVLLGTALGADPLGVLLGGGLGTGAGGLGVALVLVGRWWSAALLRRAGRAGGAGWRA